MFCIKLINGPFSGQYVGKDGMPTEDNNMIMYWEHGYFPKHLVYWWNHNGPAKYEVIQVDPLDLII